MSRGEEEGQEKEEKEERRREEWRSGGKESRRKADRPGVGLELAGSLRGRQLVAARAGPVAADVVLAGGRGERSTLDHYI